MADGYKTIKYKSFPRLESLKKMKPLMKSLKKKNYTTPKTEIMSKKIEKAPRTGPAKSTRAAKPLYDKVYK